MRVVFVEGMSSRGDGGQVESCGSKATKVGRSLKEEMASRCGSAGGQIHL